MPTHFGDFPHSFQLIEIIKILQLLQQRFLCRAPLLAMLHCSILLQQIQIRYIKKCVLKGPINLKWPGVLFYSLINTFGIVKAFFFSAMMLLFPEFWKIFQDNLFSIIHLCLRYKSGVIIVFLLVANDVQMKGKSGNKQVKW